MQKEPNNKINDFEGEANLKDFFSILYLGKWLFISITFLAATMGVIYSLLLPNIYESKALLVPVNSSGGVSGALQNYSGLAGLAGISLASSNDEGNSAKAIKKIGSLSFFENNIITNINPLDLMAVKSWDQETNKLFYDEGVYRKKKIPSTQLGFEKFTTKHLSLNEDKKSGFITLSIKHQSPFVAKQWAELVITEVNSFYRQKDKAESEKAVGYINQQISMTGFSEIKQVLAQLLQEETKKLILIEANKSYVFDYIDPPAVMEKKSEPKRFFIVVLSTLLGIVLSTLLVLVRHYIYPKKVL